MEGLTAEYPATYLHVKNSIYCVMLRSSKNADQRKQWWYRVAGYSAVAPNGVSLPSPPNYLTHEYKSSPYHLFGTCKILINPLQFPADSDFPHSKVKCIHLGINLFKMYSMDTRKLAIFARDKEKRRTSIFECAPLNIQPAVIQNNVVRKRNPRVPKNSVQKKLKI